MRLLYIIKYLFLTNQVNIFFFGGRDGESNCREYIQTVNCLRVISKHLIIMTSHDLYLHEFVEPDNIFALYLYEILSLLKGDDYFLN